jgi:hypothetical protein
MQRKHHSNGETLRRLPNIHHLSSPPGFLHTATLTHPFSPLLPSAPSQLTCLNPLPSRPAAPPPPRPPSSHGLNLSPPHHHIHGGSQPAGSAPASGRPRAATPGAPPPRPSEPHVLCTPPRVDHHLTADLRHQLPPRSPSSDSRHRC